MTATTTTTTADHNMFSGQTALVTGGRRGIGFAFARELARRGARVVITSREPNAPEVQARLADLATLSTTPPIAIAWDTAAANAADQVMSALDKEGLSVGIFVHAAHVFSPHRLILATKPEALGQSLAHNVVAPYALARKLGRAMSRARFGRVLFVSSLVASLGGAGQSAYIIEKSALEGMMRAFAAELGPRGVLVNAIAPGIVDTENVRENVTADVARAFASRSLPGRLATADEVALAGLGLVDPRQGFVTGQVLRIAGGTDGFGALPAATTGEEEEEEKSG